MRSALSSFIGLMFMTSFSAFADYGSTGLLVASGNYPELVLTTSGTTLCTGTLVGPRAVLLAAHCVDPKNPLVTFTYEGNFFNALAITSDAYETKHHDLAIALVLSDIPYVRPISMLTANLKQNVVLRILSYGCEENGDISSELDTLRMNDTVVREIKGLYMTVNKKTDSTACLAAAGAPANCYALNERYVAGVSTGLPGMDSVFVRLDTPETRALLSRVSTIFGATLCGYNKVCERY